MVLKKKIFNHTKNGFQHFFERTYLHGFGEFYQTKSITWKILWFIVVTIAVVMTIIQICQATSQYMSQQTSTSIDSTNEEDILYPPLQLCYWQWFFWVDWPKVVALNYSKESILYGFRYFNSIYSSRAFDVNEAKEKFESIIKINNFTHLFDFYNSIARPVPIVGDRNISAYFDQTKLLFSDHYLLFCYEISQEKMKEYFLKHSKKKIISFSTLDETYSSVSQFITEDEYNNYILRWVDKGSMYKINGTSANLNLTSFAPPKTLCSFNNIEKGLEMISEHDEYIVDVKVSTFAWQNTPDDPCLEDKKEFAAANTTCQNLCEARYRKQACNCLRFDHAVFLDEDFVNVTCYKDIVFLNSDKSTVSNSTQTHRQPYECSSDSKLKDEWQQCMDACVPACEIWKYEKTVSIRTTSPILRQYGAKNLTKVYIEYPVGKDILIMQVVDSQSWENFFGSVGGLLGIWTGASILSLVQILYLCCFADCEECPGKRIFSRRRSSAHGAHNGQRMNDSSQTNLSLGLTTSSSFTDKTIIEVR